MADEGAQCPSGACNSVPCTGMEAIVCCQRRLGPHCDAQSADFSELHAEASSQFVFAEEDSSPKFFITCSITVRRSRVGTPAIDEISQRDRYRRIDQDRERGA